MTLSVEATEAVPGEFDPRIEALLFGILAFGIVYAIGRLFVLRGIVGLVRTRNRENRTLVAAVKRYLGLAVLVIAAMAGVWGAGFGHVLSGSAVVVAALTIAIGVAGQEVIGNLVSGLFLVADPDFNVGDWIQWEDSAGVVETIRFRVTRVRTANNETITVPNTTLATTAVTQPYGREQYRLDLRLGIATDQGIEEAIATVESAIDDTPAALAEPAPRVLVDEVSDDALWLSIHVWIGQPTRGEVVDVRSALIRRIRHRLQAANIEFSALEERPPRWARDRSPCE